MSLIKEYQIIAAALIIACSIYLHWNAASYDYVPMGDTGVAVFKNGHIRGFCEFGVDACYYRNGTDEFWLEPINLRYLLEKAIEEDQQWQFLKQEELKEKLK